MSKAGALDKCNSGIQVLLYDGQILLNFQHLVSYKLEGFFFSNTL